MRVKRASRHEKLNRKGNVSDAIARLNGGVTSFTARPDGTAVIFNQDYVYELDFKTHRVQTMIHTLRGFELVAESRPATSPNKETI